MSKVSYMAPHLKMYIIIALGALCVPAYLHVKGPHNLNSRLRGNPYPRLIKVRYCNEYNNIQGILSLNSTEYLDSSLCCSDRIISGTYASIPVHMTFVFEDYSWATAKVILGNNDMAIDLLLSDLHSDPEYYHLDISSAPPEFLQIYTVLNESKE
jgi:hypothetical protein